MTDVHLVFKKLIERMCYKPLNGHIVHILLLLILLQTSVQLDQCTETVRLSLGQFPAGSDGKGSASNAGDPGSIPESRKSLEKGMATHSSILAWRIPWTEEPGRLQSIRLQRVRHNRVFHYIHTLTFSVSNTMLFPCLGNCK